MRYIYNMRFDDIYIYIKFSAAEKLFHFKYQSPPKSESWHPHRVRKLELSGPGF